MANPTVSPEAYTHYGMLSKYPKWGESFKDALLGSMYVESKVPKTGEAFNFKRKQDNGPAEGLFQFEKAHLDDYHKYLKDNGLTDSSESQIAFVYENMTNGGYSLDKSTGDYVSNSPHEIGGVARRNLQGMFQGTDTDAISDSLMKNYFKSSKPHMAERKKASKRYEAGLKPIP